MFNQENIATTHAEWSNDRTSLEVARLEATQAEERVRVLEDELQVSRDDHQVTSDMLEEARLEEHQAHVREMEALDKGACLQNALVVTPDFFLH